MIAKVMRGGDTRGLLEYLYGPGRANEHSDPHLVAAWRTWGVHDPGPAPGPELARLADRLDRFVLPGRPRHVWHCAVRAAHTDRALTDAEWASIAGDLLDAAGIAPRGDSRGCRWIAVRHDGDESHHIHLVATLARQDGTLPRIHNDALRLRHGCRRIEQRLGLRPTAPADRTAAPRPTRAEQERARRAGRTEPSRTGLARLARRSAATSGSDTEFFDALSAAGALVHHHRTGGALDGYALAWPHDRTAAGAPVWFSGSKLAPDLSLARVRARFPAPDRDPAPGWPGLALALRTAHAQWADHGPDRRAATTAALGDALSAAATAPTGIAAALGRADHEWAHAARPPLRAADHPAARTLRQAARRLPGTPARPGEAARARDEITALARTAARWFAEQGWRPQAAAARAALDALRA
ncbi:relaxase/mobilization nuclease domain-containing protein [Nocardiopsis potens]|uniref:relaxase/mobilization nuclease domain-containing protein n=1 Tax=Nocardiopsis potens TaxID=1246458 RepID=UPI0003452501|nr:hypothetical protein [Nocardiopsis potens]